MPTNRDVQQFMDRVQELTGAFSRGTDLRAKEAARLMDRLSRRLILLLAAESNPTGVAIASDLAFEQIKREASLIVAQYMREAGTKYRAWYREQIVGLRDNLPGVYASFGRTTVDRLIGAREVFRARARGQLFESGFADWMQEFQGIGSALVKDMQESVVLAQYNGWDQRQLARELLSRGSFRYENLPKITDVGTNLFNAGGRLGQNEAVTRRAYLNARTKLTAARNAANAVWAAEVGFETFMNFNLDPVSKQCREATAQGPMSVEEWQQWSAETGYPWRAPRHPGCDSDMIAVPADAAKGVAEVRQDELDAALSDLERGRRRDGSSVRSAA